MTSNFLTFDVEHWYEGYRHRSTGGWEGFPPRDDRTVEKLLALLEEFQIKATFFVTGAFAQDFPVLLRRVAAAGHELASHSFDHIVVDRLPSEQAFREDLRRSVCIIEDVSGEKVWGYRAPKWSIPKEVEWFYEALLSEGLKYDSSLFPHLRESDVPDQPYIQKLSSGREIWEIPATTLRLAKMRLPVAGGLWLRLFPRFVTELAFRQGQTRGCPRMIYVHPYDLDPECPRLRSAMMVSSFPFFFARYFRLASTEKILREVFQSYSFVSIRRWLDAGAAMQPITVELGQSTAR